MNTAVNNAVFIKFPLKTSTRKNSENFIDVMMTFQAARVKSEVQLYHTFDMHTYKSTLIPDQQLLKLI